MNKNNQINIIYIIVNVLDCDDNSPLSLALYSSSISNKVFIKKCINNFPLF